jgi:hypothetical protein
MAVTEESAIRNIMNLFITPTLNQVLSCQRKYRIIPL